ncbi:protein FAM217B isoform X3 [Mixophyes fleayi]|uniref:protein FAM217B isoform X3 n=1 Tax=Mixophyes fleayi TaxID=3061075 RepID=UPI003F4DE704
MKRSREQRHGNVSQSLSNRHTPEKNLFLSASQPQYKHNEKFYLDNPKQLKRAVSVHQAKYNMQKVKKESLGECCQGSRLQNKTFTSRTSVLSISKALDTNLVQPVYLSEQQELVWTLHNISSHEKRIFGEPTHERESLEKLFLDFESVGLRKEDEDSGSDLSDSERLPIPPSPFSPPDLNLRAEEIKPGYFNHFVDHNCKDYDYPDFLPPPYSSWNLSQVSVFINKEKKNTLQSTASGFLEKYVERLLQLEWLQMLTVQTENAKTAKSRPQTASGMSRNGKSQEKSTSWHSPVPSSQISRSDNISKMNSGQDKNYHRKYLHCESSGLTCACKSSPKVPGTVELPMSVFKQTQDMRNVRKKTSVLNYQQAKDFSIFGINSKIQSAGNIRPQKQSSLSSYPESTPKQTKSCKLKKSEVNRQPCCLQTIYSRVKNNSKHSETSQYKIKPK